MARSSRSITLLGWSAPLMPLVRTCSCRIGAPGAMAATGSITCGSTSYSTLISLSACLAIASLVAATAATGMAVIERLLARHGVAAHVAADGAGLHLGEILARHHRLDARQPLGRRNVDRLDAGMGMRAAQNLADQHAGQEQVGAELGAPRHLVDAVVLDRRGADDLELAVAVVAALLQDGGRAGHLASPLISLAAACTERTILS